MFIINKYRKEVCQNFLFYAGGCDIGALNLKCSIVVSYCISQIKRLFLVIWLHIINHYAIIIKNKNKGDYFMTKQNILGAFKCIALILVMLCVSIMFVACGGNGDKGNGKSEESKQQAQMREVFNSTLKKADNYNGSYKVVKVEKWKEFETDTQGNKTSKTITDRTINTLNATTNEYASVEDENNDNVIDEANYIKRNGNDSLFYRYVKGATSSGSNSYDTFKVSSDHATHEYSLANYLKEENILLVSQAINTFDRFDEVYAYIADEESIIDENATYSVKFANNNGNYTMTANYDGMLDCSTDKNSQNDEISKIIRSGQIKSIIGFTENAITKFSIEFNLTNNITVYGDIIEENEEYSFCEYDFSYDYDNALMPTNFDNYTSEPQTFDMSLVINYANTQHTVYNVEFGASLKEVYQNKIEGLGYDIADSHDGLQTDSKFYADEKFTKEIDLATATMPSYNYSFYLKPQPKADYAMIEILTRHKDGFNTGMTDYDYVNTKESTVYDLNDIIKYYNKNMGAGNYTIYSNGSVVTGTSIPVQAGKTYNLVVEYTAPLGNFKPATKEQNAMFQKVVRELDKLNSGKTSYTIETTMADDETTLSITKGTYDKNTTRKIYENISKNIFDGESELETKTQMEKIGEEYFSYTKHSINAEFTKNSITKNTYDKQRANKYIEIYLDDYSASLSTLLRSFAIEFSGSSIHYVGHEVSMTDDTLKITFNNTAIKFVLTFKFTGEQLTSIEYTVSMGNEYIQTSQTAKTNIAYQYDATMWENVTTSSEVSA